MLKIKRVYEKPSRADGLRVLVDRLWPRGVAKAAARADLWLKDIAPSDALRTWYGHEPARWPAFRRRYAAELRKNPALRELRAIARRGPVTLLYAAKDEERNNAVVLAAFLRR